MASRLEHVGIGAARDKYDATIRFYEQVFGWHKIKETPNTLCFIGDGEGGRLEILPTDAPSLASPHHLAFVVGLDEVDAIVEKLRTAGASVEAPSSNPYGDRLVFFTDPAGNRAQIVARREPLAL
jgi:predicted enzyme related to lactoylglutathione lyase